MTQKQNLEAELRNQLLRLLLFGGKSQKEMITKLCGMLDLQLEFPVQIILLYERAAKRNIKHLLDMRSCLAEAVNFWKHESVWINCFRRLKEKLSGMPQSAVHAEIWKKYQRV